MDEKTELRARDFWTSLVLIVLSLFFLWRTSFIPFFEVNVAGVESGQWYNSAGLLPFAVFGILLLLGLGLLSISIRDGGAALAMSRIGKLSDRFEAIRIVAVAAILVFYIAGLVPRVDFIIASALLINALTWAFQEGTVKAIRRSALFVIVPASYALIANPLPADWSKPLDDDWVALAVLVAMIATMLVKAKDAGERARIVRITPVVAILAPMLLVLAMAFGFRQNVPNRTGLLFKQIEYHYYVTLRPWVQGK